MTALFSNPELIRNVRAQLRPGRMLAAAIICGALSLAVGFSLAFASRQAGHAGDWGHQLLLAAVTAQAFVLLIGGGVACLHAVQREKDTNTFDFQRVTRLTPLELTLGKLFGAPAMSYFIALCLLPAAIVGAMVDRADPSFVLMGYAALIVGSIAYHAFALLISLLIERGAASGAVLVYLVLVLFPSGIVRAILDLGQLTPFFASDLVGQTTWNVQSLLAQQRVPVSGPGPMVDMVFGWPVHHAFVLIVLDAIFMGWFLLAVVRNIKRDPAVYELFTPAQALGFALYVNLILVGFFRWSSWDALSAQGVLLGLNTSLFFILGFVLIRNRDQVRRLREAGAAVEARWVTATWPAPYLMGGALLVGLGVVAILPVMRAPGFSWDPAWAIFRLVFVSLWFVRDILFLQWMNLRRGRRPLLLGLLYLVVFYTCTTLLLAAIGLYRSPQGMAVTAIFAPFSAFARDPESRIDARSLWFVALAVQVVLAGVFVSLQRRRLKELSSGPGDSAVLAA